MEKGINPREAWGIIASMKRWIGLLALIGTAALLSACTPQGIPATVTPRPTRSGDLQQYSGPPPSTTPSPTDAVTVTPLPTATPTPRTHVVRKNEDLWGIALRYGLSLEDILTANPTVNPHFLSIGTNLKIPAPLFTATPDANHPPLPTPVGLALVVPYCYPVKEGGMWCFTTGTNPQEFAIEAVSAAIRLYDRTSGEILSQTAYTPLTLSPPGGIFALAAFFPAPTPAAFDATAELLTALPVPPASGRFLTVQQPGTKFTISTDGLSAAVGGEFVLSNPQGTASRVEAAAVAFDAQGKVTGIRQWESNSVLTGSTALPFAFTVYAAGSPIDRVIVQVEAYP